RFCQQIARPQRVESPQAATTLSIEPRGLSIRRNRSARGVGSIAGDSSNPQTLAKCGSGLRRQLEEIVFFAGESLFDNGLTARRILKAYIQANALLSISRQRSVRTEDDDIGAGIRPKSTKCRFRQTVFIGKRELALRARNVFTGDHAQGAASGE